MIEYIECRNANRALLGIIDDFNSVIWHTEYFGTGDFEVHTPFTEEHRSWLAIGNFITRPDSVQIGIIERLSITYNPEEGRMLTAAGRFCLCLLERRLCLKPLVNYRAKTTTISAGTKTEVAARQLITDHIINPSWARRKISFVALGTIKNLTGITEERQSTYQNLLSFSQKVLQNGKENNIPSPYGAYMGFSRSDKKLYYNVYKGQDRSSGSNTVSFGIKPLIFSEDFDNLTSFEYTKDITNYKNDGVAGGEGEGASRFYYYLYPDYNAKRDGMKRFEQFFDESSISQTYQNAAGNDATYSNAQYAKILQTEGKSLLKEYPIETIIIGDIDVTNTGLKFAPTPEDDGDYCVGDIILLKDKKINISIGSRITSMTEVQDSEGYSAAASFDDEIDDSEDE